MTRHFRIGTLFVSLLTLVAAGCGDPPETYDRVKMLEDTASAYETVHDQLTTRATSLSDSVSSFCEDPTTDTLDSARSAWIDLRTSMRHIESWSYTGSPYRDMDLDRPLYKRDKPPASAANIDAVVQGGDARYERDLRQDGDEMPDRVFPDSNDTLDDQFVANQNYLREAKGLPAVEYLLYDGGADSNEASAVVDRYTSANNSDRRCTYLEVVTGDLVTSIEQYREAWAPDGGNFVATFTSATEGSQMWPTVQDSVNKMLSQIRFVANTLMRKQRLGGPMGEYPMNSAIPKRVEAPYSETSKQALLAALDGLQLVYSHDEGESLEDYANFRQPRVARRVSTLISESRTAIENIPAPLESAVNSDGQKVQTAISKLNDLQSYIDTNLAATLGARTSAVVVDTD